LTRKNKLGIKWRFFLYLAIFTVVTLGLLWIFQIVLLDDFYRAIKTASIRSTAESIARNVGSEELQDYLEAVAQQEDLCILLCDGEGRQLASVDYLHDCVIHRMTPDGRYALYDRALKNGGSHLETFEWEGVSGAPPGAPPLRQDRFPGIRQRDSIESIVSVSVLPDGAGGERVLMLNAIVSPVDATVYTLRVQLICISVIMLMVGFLLAVIIARTVSRPIVRINEGAKALAAGQYEMHFPETGYREIAELGRTLNMTATELGKTEALKRELIANVSHDLRTPLTMIAGYSEVMRDIPGENTPENMQIIIDETQRLSLLVNDLLDISKLQSGTQTLSVEEFSLTRTIQRTLTRYNKLTRQQGYRIEFLHDREVYVSADELRISQVIYNLVNNAINYTGPDRLVILRQIVGEGFVRIEVVDTGEGIAEENLPLIWDRYYKVDKEHKQAAIGTGLGLSIVRSVMELHGGGYGVESTLGQGSCFWFSLPVLPPPES